MGKTRGLFEKIRDTKGTFHAKMGSIKDRNGMDLTEAEDIKKRWQEYNQSDFGVDHLVTVTTRLFSLVTTRLFPMSLFLFFFFFISLLLFFLDSTYK